MFDHRTIRFNIESNSEVIKIARNRNRNPYIRLKSPGVDGIFPELLQRGLEIILRSF